MSRTNRLHWVAAVGVAAAAVPLWVTAQGMDPTRPPFAVPTVGGRTSGSAGAPGTGNAPVSSPIGGAAQAAPAPAAEGAPQAQRRTPASSQSQRLTSIMWGGPNGSAAVIDGEVVRVGEKVRGATLVSIDRLGVTLKGGDGAGRLLLFSRPADPAPLPPSEGASAPGKDTP